MGRTGGVILLSLATLAALLAFVVVAARVVEQGDARLAEAKLDFVLGDMDETIERNLQLGLPLAELQQIEPLLEEVLASTPGLLAVDVFSQTGITLFSTDRGAVGEPVPPPWLEAIGNRRGAARWRATEPETITLGGPLINDFDQTEGWVALIIDKDALVLPLTRVPTLLVAAAPITLGASVIAGIIGFLVMRRRDHDMEGALAAISRHEPIADPATPLGSSSNEAVVTALAATRTLETAAEELRRLDAEV
ncbi:hypothetical protein [Acuticoccus mangrovi]|uniref:Uncharacterized protein n=1 Tax=Acuticoccus mangrovi TaxID=2796142 RepID=A0A934IM39_9HYPH|nr:hypothetical protein [Acuticoccus mangrovi]MBJ3776342.1 hypothetical protein [Acuticoccus mangrovi]